MKFSLESHGAPVGTMEDGDDAWTIDDLTGTEVARAEWTGEGVSGLAVLFTNADSYALSVHQRLEDPLRSLVIAAPLAIDLALNQF